MLLNMRHSPIFENQLSTLRELNFCDADFSLSSVGLRENCTSSLDTTSELVVETNYKKNRYPNSQQEQDKILR